MSSQRQTLAKHVSLVKGHVSHASAKPARGDQALIARLKELEAESGSFAALSRATGIHEATLRSYVKKGIRVPSDNILKIADGMKVSIEWLVAGRGPKRMSLDEEGRLRLPFEPKFVRESVEALETVLQRDEKECQPAPKARILLLLYRFCEEKTAAGEPPSKDQIVEVARALVA